MLPPLSVMSTTHGGLSGSGKSPERSNPTGGRRDGLKWPHCDGLNWPHLCPIGGRAFVAHRARAGGASGDVVEDGAVRADQAGPRSGGLVDPGVGGAVWGSSAGGAAGARLAVAAGEASGCGSAGAEVGAVSGADRRTTDPAWSNPGQFEDTENRRRHDPRTSAAAGSRSQIQHPRRRSGVMALARSRLPPSVWPKPCGNKQGRNRWITGALAPRHSAWSAVAVLTFAAHPPGASAPSTAMRMPARVSATSSGAL